MASANLTDIYHMLGDLQATVRATESKLDGIASDMRESEDKADMSRANVHRRLDEVVLRTGHLEADMSTVKHKVEGMETVTDDIKIMRERARGAGTLGVWLWRIGGGILSAAGGFAAAYTWLTGRPPP